MSCSDKKKSNRISVREKTLISFVLFICGGLIYILFRTESLVMFQWFKAFKLLDFINYIRQGIGVCITSDFIRFCLPDGLWLLSYLILMDAVWGNTHNLWSFFFYAILPFIAICSEILQYFSLLSGTFDLGDIVAYLCSLFLFIIYIHLIYE